MAFHGVAYIVAFPEKLEAFRGSPRAILGALLSRFFLQKPSPQESLLTMVGHGLYTMGTQFRFAKSYIAGWSSLVARWAHNPKVVGSNPAPATKFKKGRR